MKTLFDDERQHSIGIIGVAAVALHGMIAAKHSGSEEELCESAFKIARVFMKRAEDMFDQSNTGNVSNG